QPLITALFPTRRSSDLTDHTKRAKTDRSLWGIKKRIKEDPVNAHKTADQVIRNTYRTLLTRGQKGCFVYCTDKKLASYFKERLQDRKSTRLNSSHVSIS